MIKSTESASWTHATWVLPWKKLRTVQGIYSLLDHYTIPCTKAMVY